MKIQSLLVASLLVSACAANDQGDVEDGENDVATGKADSPAEGSDDARLILALVNDSGVDQPEFDNIIGLSSRVATGIVAHRDGADRTPGTADDDLFDSLTELDAIPYLGPKAMGTLLAYARKQPTTTLTFNMVAHADWGSDDALDLTTLNDQLAQYNISFPKSLTLGAREGARFNKVLADVEVANEKLGRHIDFDLKWNPGEYNGLCYTGDVAGVPDLVEGLRESVFSLYMGIQGQRWGTHKDFFYSAVEGDTEAEWIAGQNDQGNEDAMSVWTSYDTSSSSFLMMVDGGEEGDGTEFFAVTIPPCP